MNPKLSIDAKLLNNICGTTHKLSLKENTTNHGQPDHVVLHKQFETNSFSTSFFNFVSDHKAIVLRLGLMNNCYDEQFLRKINFDSEKHLKKLESKS